MGKVPVDFGWGCANGLLFAVPIKYGVDISQEGLHAMILNALKPMMDSIGMSTWWITLAIIILGIASIVSLYFQIRNIIKKGNRSIVLAASGFAGMFLLIMWVTWLGVAVLGVGLWLSSQIPKESK